MILDKVVVFLNTCDKNKDVCEYFLLAFDKYWKDNRLQKIAGINAFDVDVKKHGFSSISVEPANWRVETIYQLKWIKREQPNITHVLLFLDDFILNKSVNNGELEELIENMTDEKYIRLKVLEEGLFFKMLNFLKKRKMWGNLNGIKIRRTHPYYSSLQVAIWDIDYLLMGVENCTSIWDFETPKFYHLQHYSTYSNIFNYRHIVEKGEWNIGVKKYCQKHVGNFDSGERIQRKLNIMGLLKLKIKESVFFVFGYSIMKLRRKIKL